MLIKNSKCQIFAGQSFLGSVCPDVRKELQKDAGPLQILQFFTTEIKQRQSKCPGEVTTGKKTSQIDSLNHGE